ncbi:DUF2282 domain-containing protein [Neptuniibacter sp. QD29_5]|uniref:BufA1 family periplasmic bufferin-type metallophore n=1 Tax=Neptuniibacter sp. QD29_5 TaxID=3398207 RepID=UPI0039F46055
MNNKQHVATTALAVALSTIATLPSAHAAGKEKCYGVALAGQNDCGNLAGTHSCAGQSKTDNDSGEWKLVAKGTCKEMGGLLKAEAKKRYAEQQKS